MYLVGEDVKHLCRLLDDDPDIALIVADGPGRWKAQRHVPTLRDGEHMLWHIPSGPIELESRKLKEKPKKVRNPFAGWDEIVRPVERGVPWIGPGPLGIIYFRIRRRARRSGCFRAITARPSWTAPANKVIGLSTFSWIGNYYSIIGRKAADSTQKWWGSLRRRVAKLATRVPTTGALTGYPKDIWAFPAALALIRRGVKRADNPS